jgi:hypothetical protein
MKNLKSAFEKEDLDIWKDSTTWEPSGKKNKRFRKGRTAKRMNENKRKEKVRLTWD